jgi:carboxyl-terminal processing protease
MTNSDNPIKNSPSTVRLPILLGLTLVSGIFLGARFLGGSGTNDVSKGYTKFKEVLQLVDNNYVDTVNTDELVDYSITKMLEKLDPHTTYFPPAEADAVRSQLSNGYDGIGVEFNLFKDTVQVVSALSGGPSEAVGIQGGDKMIRVDGQDFTGKKITNAYIYSKLRGQRGTEVKIDMLRAKKVLSFTVKRDRIPTYSVDAAYMTNGDVGYLKVTKFAEGTYDEFKNAVKLLKSQGMKKLLLDLRGNPGGYMDRATNIVDELLGGDKLIVYTDGKDNRYDHKTNTTFDGMFEDNPVVVLIDEGSASASEIVAGALQDHDRALIVGRRSFGKGLVQMPVNLSDGSELRITISRYYTPTGRSIQKPYEKGHLENYEKDMKQRLDGGELFVADSIKNNPKLRFKTDGGRMVYGGGGITPDVFVGQDTSQFSNYLYALWGQNIIREYALQYANSHRKELEKMLFIDYLKGFAVTESDLQQVQKAATEASIKFNEREYNRSKNYIKTQLKAYIGRYVFQKKGQNNGLNNEYYQAMSPFDNTYMKALTLFGQAEQLTKNNVTKK